MGIRTSWTPSGTETKTIGPPKIIRTRHNQTKNTNWAERKRPTGPTNKTKETTNKTKRLIFLFAPTVACVMMLIFSLGLFFGARSFFQICLLALEEYH